MNRVYTELTRKVGDYTGKVEEESKLARLITEILPSYFDGFNKDKHGGLIGLIPRRMQYLIDAHKKVLIQKGVIEELMSPTPSS